MESNPSDLFQQTVRNRRREALERIQPAGSAEGARWLALQGPDIPGKPLRRLPFQVTSKQIEECGKSKSRESLGTRSSLAGGTTRLAFGRFKRRWDSPYGLD